MVIRTDSSFRRWWTNKAIVSISEQTNSLSKLQRVFPLIKWVMPTSSWGCSPYLWPTTHCCPSLVEWQTGKPETMLLVCQCLVTSTHICWLKECYRIGKKQNHEDHRFTSNLHGLMMMIVENIPWNISVCNVTFDEK